MNSENSRSRYAGDNAELTSHLRILIANGWSDQQIMKLARLRVNYSRNGDLYPVPTRLAFARWLYEHGKLKS